MTNRPGEFEIIERYFAPISGEGSFGLRDDAALLDVPDGHSLVVSQDAVAEGIHFFPDDPSDLIARKALRVNLSDLAAKGAKASSISLALGLGNNWNEKWIASFADGLRDDCLKYGVILSGGDTFTTGSRFVISMTAIGHIPKENYVSRQGACDGDRLLVSGTIGDGALGLKIRSGQLDLGAEANSFLVDRYLLPQPRTALSEAISANATSAMDVSDGLVGDAEKLSHASGFALTINADDIPFSDAVRSAIKKDPSCFETAISGGDDYEILFTVHPENVINVTERARSQGISLAEIGFAHPGEGVSVRDAEGRAVRLTRSGYNHSEQEQ